MIFEAQDIIVKLGEGEDEATITFAESTDIERLELAELWRDGEILKARQIIFKKCIECEKLYLKDKEITVEDVTSGNLIGTIANALMVGYFGVLFPQKDEETQEKNE